MGQTVRFDQGVVGLDAHRIVPELTCLQEETTEALQKSASPQQQAMAIACFHARFRRTHPFLDGNMRTSAVLLEGQMHAVFNLQPRIPQRPDDYKLILAQAYRGEIAPLTNHILSATGHALVEAGPCGDARAHVRPGFGNRDHQTSGCYYCRTATRNPEAIGIISETLRPEKKPYDFGGKASPGLDGDQREPATPHILIPAPDFLGRDQNVAQQSASRAHGVRRFWRGRSAARRVPGLLIKPKHIGDSLLLTPTLVAKRNRFVACDQRSRRQDGEFSK